MSWIDAEKLKRGEVVRIRRQSLRLERVDRQAERVTLTGIAEDGRMIIYVGAVGEAIEKPAKAQVLQELYHGNKEYGETVR